MRKSAATKKRNEAAIQLFRNLGFCAIMALVVYGGIHWAMYSLQWFVIAGNNAQAQISLATFVDQVILLILAVFATYQGAKMSLAFLQDND